MRPKQAQIKSGLQTIGQILSTDFRYKVPPHQRNFAWGEEVEQLWNDILEAMKENTPEYFLGTIVVQEDRNEKIRHIIDGQQRLAVLTAIFSAIRTVYAENRDERADEVYQDYLGAKDRRTRVIKPRLTLNEVNGPTFEKLIVQDLSDKEIDDVIKNKAQPLSNIRLAKAIQFIRDAVRRKAQDAERYDDFLINLEGFIRDRVVAILVIVDDEADAYLIFETLNDRGLELSISDLLKNYIFSGAGNKLSTVRNQWQEMVVILGTQDLPQFLRHYWLSRYGVVRVRGHPNLYKEIKKKFYNQGDILKLMSELRESAEKYAAILSVDHQIWKGYGTSVRKDLETLQLFGLSQFRPLLLSCLDKLEEREISKVIHMIVVISMRYSIICSLGTGIIEKAYSDAAVAVREGKANTAAKIFEVLKTIYPDDARFEADFAQKEIPKSKLARYILAAIANKKGSSKLTVLVEDEKIVTLEHIMPKTRSDQWQQAAKDEDEYLAYVNRLGNLTLIEREKIVRLAMHLLLKRKIRLSLSLTSFLQKIYANIAIGQLPKLMHAKKNLQK